MAGVKIEIENQQSLSDLMQRAVELSSDQTLLFQDIGEYLLLSHNERWDQQISPQGTPWLPLSPAYLASEAKQKSRGGSKILVFGGYLKNLNYRATDKSLKVGTPMVYGATHQFGDDARGIPARPFLGISKEDENEIGRLIGKQLERLMK